MEVVSVCARCHGKGEIDRDCDDPQCGDSTWDHDCTLGSDPCPECKCPNCGASGMMPSYEIDPFPVGGAGGIEHADLVVCVLHMCCPACNWDFTGHQAERVRDAVSTAYFQAVRRVMERAKAEK